MARPLISPAHTSGCNKYGIGMQTEKQGKNSDSGAALEFEDVVERFYRPLYQFAFSLTGSEADAWDLAQHTFFTWRTKGDQLRDPTKIRAWLFTTLHRAFLQGKRRETRFPHYDLDQVDSELPSIPPHEHSALDSADLLAAMGKMDEVFRAPLALFYLEDCPYKEIALILDVPLGTVKSRIARGITQLKELLTGGERVAA